MNIHGTITVVKNREDGNDVEETNILVVDDEKEIADLLEIYLISDGFQVLKAYSAKEGLRILEEKKIDLVLLDVMMPDMDGQLIFFLFMGGLLGCSRHAKADLRLGVGREKFAGDLPFVNIRSVMAHIHMQQHIRLMHSRRDLYFIFIRLLSAFVGGYPISLPGSPAPVYYPISPAFHSYDMSATLRGDLQWYLRSIIRPCPFLKLSVNPASRIHRFYRQSPAAAITYITAAKYKFHKASN